jgi:uncharacterized protein YkwD
MFRSQRATSPTFSTSPGSPRRPLSRFVPRALAFALLAVALPLARPVAPVARAGAAVAVRPAPARPYTVVLGQQQRRLSSQSTATHKIGARRNASGVSAPLAEMLTLINAERAQAGDGPLHIDATLSKIAASRSQDMIAHHYFAHEIPGVPGVHLVFDLLDRAKVPYEMAGENIALNNYINFYPIAKTIEQTNTDLMNSPEHKANLLEPKYTAIGLGLTFEQGSGKLILTEVFTQP